MVDGQQGAAPCKGWKRAESVSFARGCLLGVLLGILLWALIVATGSALVAGCT